MSLNIFFVENIGQELWWASVMFHNNLNKTMALPIYTEDDINKVLLTLSVLSLENWLIDEKQKFSLGNPIKGQDFCRLQPHLEFCHSGNACFNYFVLQNTAKILWFKYEEKVLKKP